MVVRSTVTDDNRSTDRMNRADQDRLREQILAECREWMVDYLRRERER
jgi:hypothetical protein